MAGSWGSPNKKPTKQTSSNTYRKGSGGSTKGTVRSGPGAKTSTKKPAAKPAAWSNKPGAMGPPSPKRTYKLPGWASGRKKASGKGNPGGWIPYKSPYAPEGFGGYGPGADVMETFDIDDGGGGGGGGRGGGGGYGRGGGGGGGGAAAAAAAAEADRLAKIAAYKQQVEEMIASRRSQLGTDFSGGIGATNAAYDAYSQNMSRLQGESSAQSAATQQQLAAAAQQRAQSARGDYEQLFGQLGNFGVQDPALRAQAQLQQQSLGDQAGRAEALRARWADVVNQDNAGMQQLAQQSKVATQGGLYGTLLSKNQEIEQERLKLLMASLDM